jgi:hypothetical protein
MSNTHIKKVECVCQFSGVLEVKNEVYHDVGSCSLQQAGTLANASSLQINVKLALLWLKDRGRLITHHNDRGIHGDLVNCSIHTDLHMNKKNSFIIVEKMNLFCWNL